MLKWISEWSVSENWPSYNNELWISIDTIQKEHIHFHSLYNIFWSQQSIDTTKSWNFNIYCDILKYSVKQSQCFLLDIHKQIQFNKLSILHLKFLSNQVFVENLSIATKLVSFYVDALLVLNCFISGEKLSWTWDVQKLWYF